jgi:Uma2 family endonuclease
MAETDAHARAIIDSRTALEHFFAGEADVYVSGTLLVYYQEGDPRQAVAPDVFVVRGVAKAPRRIYKLWDEQQPPHFVLEITSRSTRAEDLGAKFGLYQLLGVREYFLFDPLGEYLDPPLQGYRLVEGRYERLARVDQEGTLASTVLGLELRLRDGTLRFYDPTTGQWLLTPSEAERARRAAQSSAAAEAAARQRAEAHAAAEAAARQRAEAELARAQEELARLREALAQGGSPGAQPGP